MPILGLSGKLRGPPYSSAEDERESALIDFVSGLRLPPTAPAPSPVVDDVELAPLRPSARSIVAVSPSGGPASASAFEPLAGFVPADQAPPAEMAELRTRFATDGAAASAPISDEEKIQAALALAEQRAAQNRGWADIQQGGARIGSAISGAPVDEEYFKELHARAGDPVAQAKLYAQNLIQGRKSKIEANRAAREERRLDADLKSKEEQLKLEARKLDQQGKHQEAEEKRQGAAALETSRHNRATESIARTAAQTSREKAEGPTKGTVVPGLEVTPGAAPTAEDAKKVKMVRASAASMRAYVDELKKLHAKYGTEYGGEVGNRMQQLGTEIQIEAKNIAELGALSGGDKKLMEELAGAEPGSLWANVKGFVSGGLWDSTQSALKGVDKWVADREAAVQSTYGYREAPGSGPSNVGQAQQRLREGSGASSAPPVKVLNGKRWVLQPDGSYEEEG